MQQDFRRKIPELQGTLPPLCRQDLDSIKASVRKALAGAQPSVAVNEDEFMHVFLTGGTGLIGRFMLKELLLQKDNLIVHCLVRADNDALANERIKDAMIAADIWDDEFEDRIKVICGDISQEGLGLDHKVFDKLCEEIDAVYHLAADIALISPYEKLRAVNVRSMSSILELCLKNRFKHLFFTSTLGLFPAYFFGFSKEYSRHFISDRQQPDLTEIKRKFPMNLTGYIWSKLVSEQAIRYAQSTSMPATIFRLPKTCMASNGYNNVNDIQCRIFGAALELKMAPPGFSPDLFNEPADFHARICTAISLNPQKGYPIYHCCNSYPTYEEIKYIDLGINFREVPYERFRQACQTRGSKSPLYGYWPLLDYIQSYIFTKRPWKNSQPISDEAIRRDCGFELNWPLQVINHDRSNDWINGSPDRWPWVMPQIELNIDQLLERAEELASNLQIQFETAYPEWMQTALDKLVKCYNSEQNENLPRKRKSDTTFQIFNILRKNAELAYEYKHFPEISDEKIVKPVFILGINRTGTSLMHRLMSRGQRFWSLLAYELDNPVLLDGNYWEIAWTHNDPRRSHLKARIDAKDIKRKFSGIHTIDVNEPVEEFRLLELAFTSWTLPLIHNLPGYMQWMIETGSREAYRHHRRIMQHYSWQRKQKNPNVQLNWLLKMPFHLMELATLLETYPDAVFIQTHRAPETFMGSWFSLVERIRASFGDEQSRSNIGRKQLAFMSKMLNDAIALRTTHPEIDNRFVDILYTDLVKDPMGTIRKIYDKFTWELDVESKASMQSWLTIQELERQKEPKHRYSIDDFGISSEDIAQSFDPYLKFTQQKGLSKL